MENRLGYVIVQLLQSAIQSGPSTSGTTFGKSTSREVVVMPPRTTEMVLAEAEVDVLVVPRNVLDRIKLVVRSRSDLSGMVLISFLI